VHVYERYGSRDRARVCRRRFGRMSRRSARVWTLAPGDGPRNRVRRP
jgi:hypothetical protein